MSNAQNHINALGEGNQEIRFVLHGNGVELLRKVSQEITDAANRIDSLRSQGVKFKICANTFKGRKIALEDLHFAKQPDVVPSGVAEIGKLQQRDLFISDHKKDGFCRLNTRYEKLSR